MSSQTSNRNVFLENYLSLQRPVGFQKSVTTLKKHSSDHQAISEHEERLFNIVDNLDDYLVDMELQRENMLVASLKEDHWLVEFSTESDIQSKVECCVRDALRTLGLAMEVSITRDSQIRAARKVDIWVIKTKSGRPLAVCEVKCPVTFKDEETNGSYSVLAHENVLGQLFDYMVELRTMFGQCEVFGILTNLKEWRYCWFPDTDDAAQSNGCEPLRYESFNTQFHLKSHLLLNRVLYHSKLYSLQDVDFPKSLLSVLLKSYKANFRHVPLLSVERIYLCYSDKAFFWESMSEEDMKTNILLSMPSPQTKNFKVLRFFHGGATGIVFLAVTASFNLVVVKVYSDENKESAQRETQMWCNLYDIGVFCTKIRVDKAVSWGVVMPMALHVIANVADRTVVMQPNLVEWSKEKLVVADETEIFDDWTEKLRTAVNSMDLSIPQFANQAIRELANKSYIHTDLKWQHFALLPVLESDGREIQLMRPILIDLQAAQKHDDADEAYSEMKIQLDALCDEYNLPKEPSL